jgi:tetratricopeptide (TPR) repeat protein
MLGDTDGGRADLDRSLQLDPSQRQAWLNLAGLEITEAHYDKALESLAKARALDPDNPDNDLNTGAVYLLQGRLPEATERFRGYLQAAPDQAAAHYLVATNYAGRGYARLAVETLRKAIGLDELYRVRARTDPNFEAVADAPELKALLEEPPARPPADHRVARQAFPTPYDGGHGQLLSAVLEALHQIGATFDPRVEVASQWALIHGPLRIQLYDRPGSKGGGAEGVVQVSAAPETLAPDQWKQRTGQLFQAVELALLRRQPRDAPSPKEPPPPGS